jgi:hypothetical protein
MEQARELIEVYNDLIAPQPVKPTVMGRASFCGLPKRVAAKPIVAPSRPATMPSAAPRVTTEPMPPVRYPAHVRAKPPAHNFDPHLEIARGGVEDIPW